MSDKLLVSRVAVLGAGVMGSAMVLPFADRGMTLPAALAPQPEVVAPTLAYPTFLSHHEASFAMSGATASPRGPVATGLPAT